MTVSRRERNAGAMLATLLLVAASAGCSRTPAEPSASDCPSLLPGTSNSLVDYADLLIWQQRAYVADQELPGEDLSRPLLGRRVTTISCNVYEWSTKNGGLRAADLPWPDGTATGLEVGAPVRALQGVEAECALAARGHDGDLRVFVAVDLDSEGVRALCG